MTAIPPVEVRQYLSCVGCFAEQLPVSQHCIQNVSHPAMCNLAWCKVYDEPIEKCRSRIPKCPYRFTLEDHRAILDRHNVGEQGTVIDISPWEGATMYHDIECWDPVRIDGPATVIIRHPREGDRDA